MKIHFVQATLDGCSLVQCLLPAKYINKLKGHNATLSDGQETIERGKFEDADVIVLQRQIINSVFQEVKKYVGKKLIVYDLDDDMWGLEKDNPHSADWPVGKLKFLDLFIEQSDLITVHSAGVYERMIDRFPNKKVELMPDIVDLDSVDKIEGEGIGYKEGTRVGWIGSTSHKTLIDHIGHAVFGAIRRNPELISVWLGYSPTVEAQKDWSRYEFYDWVNRENFYSVLGSLGLDIGLAPLWANDFALTRSLRKIQDYAMFGIPAIVSDYGPFSTLPDDMVVKVNKKNRIVQWIGEILNLAKNEDKRKEMSLKMKEWVQRFDGNTQAPKWIEVYGGYL